jgi:mannitol 2-dehydrogenase
MKKLIKLNQENLASLPEHVTAPSYNRKELKAGIAHIGVGGFHRAHQQSYTDELIGKYSEKNWGIVGMGIREEDRKMYNALQQQDYLYTLMAKSPDGSTSAKVIGSMVGYVMAPDKPQAAIEQLAAPNIKIVTLTITEGGYNFDDSTGKFNFDNPGVQWDLAHRDQPKTVFGYLAAALSVRKERGMPAFTIQSCDNIIHNGNTAKAMMLSFTGQLDGELSQWIENNVCFPNSMVDRITPVTTDNDIKELKDNYGINDRWPVVCEPFKQWIIEDNFTSGRPRWEKTGAQFVSDVEPYEQMKLRLLNAGHSLLGFMGTLSGYTTTDEAVKDPLLQKTLRRFMDAEATPTLGGVEGINLTDYKNSLIERFGNPSIKDKLSRICSESSAKIPKFVLPTVVEQLESGGAIKIGAALIVAWCRYLELADSPNHPYEVQDAMHETLKQKATESINGDPLAFLKINTIFGDLADAKRFTESYLLALTNLRHNAVSPQKINVE